MPHLVGVFVCSSLLVSFVVGSHFVSLLVWIQKLCVTGVDLSREWWRQAVSDDVYVLWGCAISFHFFYVGK